MGRETQSAHDALLTSIFAGTAFSTNAPEVMFAIIPMVTEDDAMYSATAAEYLQSNDEAEIQMVLLDAEVPCRTAADELQAPKSTPNILMITLPDEAGLPLLVTSEICGRLNMDCPV